MNRKAMTKYALALVVAVTVVLAASIVFAATRQCQDGIDNDGDTKIDYPADPGYTSSRDTSESGVVQSDNKT